MEIMNVGWVREQYCIGVKMAEVTPRGVAGRLVGQLAVGWKKA